jgi:hypothetical protein
MHDLVSIIKKAAKNLAAFFINQYKHLSTARISAVFTC